MENQENIVEDINVPEAIEFIDDADPYRRYRVLITRNVVQNHYNKIVAMLLILTCIIIWAIVLWTINSTYTPIIDEFTNEYIKKQLNFKVDPCDDFYEFVCSKFIEETVIPEDKAIVQPFTELAEKLNEQLRSILESNSSKHEIKPYKVMRSVYQACMDIETLNKKGLTPLYEVFPDFKKWPFTSGDFQNYDWKEQLLEYRRIDSIKPYLLSVNIAVNSKNSTQRIVEIDEPSFGIDTEFLIEGYENQRVESYYNFIINISNLMNNNEDRSKQIKEMVDFEIELAKLTSTKEERRNISNFYNYQQLGDIDHINYKIFKPNGFLDFVRRLFIDQNDTEMVEIIKLNEHEPINNRYPIYIKRLDELLSKTNQRIIKNYLTWRYILTKLPLFDETIRDAILHYSSQISGVLKRQPRWKECLLTTTYYTEYTMHSAYVREYFDEESKADVIQILENIKEEFRFIIQNLDWMDSKTKLMALKKLDNMKSIVGYPEELIDNCAIQTEYKYLNTVWKENDLFGSFLRLYKHQTNEKIKELRKPINKNHWRYFSRVAVINAFYSPLKNSIILPAGILQGLFYNKKQPRAMNYGGIGTVIAHELTHGFDDEGSQYDEKGNLRDWWTSQTKYIFETRRDKIIDQYMNYTEPISGLKLNGEGTQGENIADNAAVIEAYRALKKLNVTNERLEGFEFTEQQLYWIAYGRIWCMACKKQEMITMIKTGMHSPGRFRTNGALQNSIDFAKDFKCKEGSYMNPKIKNIIYG